MTKYTDQRELSEARRCLKDAIAHERQCNDAVSDAHSGVLRAKKRIQLAERAVAAKS